MKRPLSLLLLTALTLAPGGCYKRVVATRGIGSMGTGVQEEYRSNTAADRWIDDTFSKPAPKMRTSVIDMGRTAPRPQEH